MFRRTLCLFAGSLCLASVAGAELPAVLNHMPNNGVAAVVIPSLDRLDANVAALAAATEAPLPATPKQALAMLGIQQGLDTSRPIAMFLAGDVQGEDFDPEDLMESVVLLLPTTDFEALVGQFNAEMRDGVFAFEMNNSPTYARPLGADYAAFSPSLDAVRGFAPAANLAKVQGMLGARGVELAERSDVYVVINPAPFAERIKAGMQEGRAEIDGQAEMMGMMMGQDPEQLKKSMLAAMDMMESFANDMGGMVLGANVNALGASMDFATSFKQGTKWAGYFNDPGSASSLLKRLPDNPFLIAMAMDTSSPGVQSLMKELVEMSEGFNGAGVMGFNMADMIKDHLGVSMAWYPSPGGMMGGLMTGAVQFIRSDNPDVIRAEQRAAIEQLANAELPGMQMTGEYTPESVDAGGVKADSWRVTMGGEQGDPMMMQGMMMLFGPGGGPNGLLAQTRDGVYMTYSQNPASLTAAMNTGDGNSIADNRALAQVAARLPKNSMMEYYFGVQSIIDMVAPMAAMFVGPVDLGAGGDLPPIGIGVSTGGSSFHAGLFVPAPIIQHGVRIANNLQEMEQGGGGAPPF